MSKKTKKAFKANGAFSLIFYIFLLKIQSLNLLFMKDRIGHILMKHTLGNHNIREKLYNKFSETLIKADIAMKSCCIDDSIFDQ
jgi:hypothetical protein